MLRYNTERIESLIEGKSREEIILLMSREIGGLITKNLKLEEELGETRKLALTDFLTGLPNRRAFDLEVPHYIGLRDRHGTQFHLVLVDLDDFKSINDTYGYEVGDRVLQSVAKTMSSHIRNTDFIARLGGDEFVLIIDSASYPDLSQILERIRGDIRSMSIPGFTETITASMGASELTNLGETFRNANKVLQTVKYLNLGVAIAGK